jgi:hypothetical protein
MNRQQQVFAVANAYRLLDEARQRDATPKSSGVPRPEVTARQRAIRSSIQRRRDPAARTRVARLAETNEHLVTELDKLRDRIATRDELDQLLEQALTATSAEKRTRPIRTEGAARLSQRNAPLRFIIDLGEERTAADGRVHVARCLRVRLSPTSDRWPSVEPLFNSLERHKYFVLALPMSRASGAEDRFLIASAIKDRCGAVSVQPDELIAMTSSFKGSFKGVVPPTDTEWPLDVMKVFDAWGYDPVGNGRKFGEGETIGHLDSGWFDHPEYDEERLDLERAYNAETEVQGKTASKHSYEGGLHETHGLGTGALMVSHAAAEGTTAATIFAEPGVPTGEELEISGVAPAAKVLPVRCFDFVFVTMTTVALARGAAYLIGLKDENDDPLVGVISMSFGGFPHHSFEEVLNGGVRENNVIAIASGGQLRPDFPGPLGAVAAPAAYKEVIAVAASTPQGAPASWTFGGPEIDIAAPGESVWVANVVGQVQDDRTVHINRFVGHAHGTSFSCSLTSGVAALWRAFFADQLKSGIYDDVPFAHIFRQHLRDSANRPAGWDTSLFGAGTINVDRLLSTPLPAPADVQAPSESGDWTNPFLGVVASHESALEVVEGLLNFGNGLGKDLADLGKDVSHAVAVTIAEEVAAKSELAKAGIALGLTTSLKAAAAGLDLIGDTWAAIDSFADDIGDEFEQAAAAASEALADAYEEGAEYVEDVAEAAAEAVEKGAEEIVDLGKKIIEKATKTAKGGSKAVVDAFTKVFKFP